MTPSAAADMVIRIMLCSPGPEEIDEIRGTLTRAFHARFTQAELLKAAKAGWDHLGGDGANPAVGRPLIAAIEAALEEPS